MFDLSKFTPITINQIYINISNGYMYMSKRAYELLKSKWVVFYVNEDTKQIAIKKVKTKTKYAVQLKHRYGDGKYLEFFKNMFGQCKIMGKYYEDEQCIIFGKEN